MASMKLRFSLPHATLFVALLLTETVIALFVHDHFIRPLCGDALVVILVWAAWQSVLRSNPYLVALGSLLFAFVVETGQYFHLVDRIGLGHNHLARIVLGVSFDPHDFVAYTLGALIIVLVCRSRGVSHPPA